MVLSNAFAFIPGQYADQKFFSPVIALLAFRMLFFNAGWLATWLIAIFLARYFKISIISGWESYEVKSILLAVKSGYFFPRKVDY